MLDLVTAIRMECTINFVSSQVLEFGMVARVDYFKRNDLQHYLFQLALVKRAFTNSVNIIEIEWVMLLYIIFVVGKQIVIYLEVPKCPPPLVIHPLFIGPTHGLNFLVVLPRLVLCSLKLQILHVFNGILLLLVLFQVLD